MDASKQIVPSKNELSEEKLSASGTLSDLGKNEHSKHFLNEENNESNDDTIELQVMDNSIHLRHISNEKNLPNLTDPIVDFNELQHAVSDIEKRDLEINTPIVTSDLVKTELSEEKLSASGTLSNLGKNEHSKHFLNEENNEYNDDSIELQVMDNSIHLRHISNEKNLPNLTDPIVDFNELQHAVSDIEKRDLEINTPIVTSDLVKNEDLVSKKFGCLRKCACILSCYLFISHFADIGKLLFQIFSQVLYIFDVVTDIYSGTILIAGDPINQTMFGNENYDNYTKNVCAHLTDYRHPVWGSINIAIAWIPSFVFLSFLITSKGANGNLRKWNFFGRKWKQITIIEKMKRIAIIVVCFIFWPVIGLIL